MKERFPKKRPVTASGRKEKPDNPGVLKLRGQIVDVHEDRIYPGEIRVEDGRIADKREMGKAPGRFIIPGFIDSHIHIESSMMPPSLFAEVSLPHGTVAVVNDPHEIANVAGLTGISYMTADAHDAPLKFYFTAPSCVPATSFETSGATIGPGEIAKLLSRPDFVALGEVMNYPGVLDEDPDVIAKIEAAKKAGKPIDGHCPGLSGEGLRKYAGSGISTDHECTTLDEAREKARAGMTIQIRDGSASKDLDRLWPIINEEECFIVSDDKHPGDLASGHMDESLAKAVRLGADPLRAVKAATLWPSRHYGLESGRMAVGSPADLAIVKDIRSFRVVETYIGGLLVASKGASLWKSRPLPFSPCMRLPDLGPHIFETHTTGGMLDAIEIIPDSIVTLKAKVPHGKGTILSDRSQGTNLVSVVSRYGNGSYAVGLVKGFGLGRGALGCTVAHDSHNLVVVGFDSPAMYRVAEALSEGGLAAYDGRKVSLLPLEIAGLMTGSPPRNIEERIRMLEAIVRGMGCPLAHPFMTLSFVSLLVIPHIKLSDRGLFDVDAFGFAREKGEGEREE